MGRSYLTLRLLLWVSLTIATVLARSTQQVSFRIHREIFTACRKILRWIQITIFSSFRALPACDLSTAPDPTRFAPSSEHATVGQERCSSQVATRKIVARFTPFGLRLLSTKCWKLNVWLRFLGDCVGARRHSEKCSRQIECSMSGDPNLQCIEVPAPGPSASGETTGHCRCRKGTVWSSKACRPVVGKQSEYDNVHHVGWVHQCTHFYALVFMKIVYFL